VAGLKRLFMTAIQQTDRKRLNSLLMENAATCNTQNAAIDPKRTINVPVLRVIGTKDETWEVDLGNRYAKQIPHMTTRFVKNAGHKDVFFRASEFYDLLDAMLKEEALGLAIS
jgi:pimeloyl-ACP methyl ester carboxylesterase